MPENHMEKNIENKVKNTFRCLGYHTLFGFTYRFGGLGIHMNLRRWGSRGWGGGVITRR